MATERKISIRFISGANKEVEDFDAGIQESITYAGKAVAVKLVK